MGVRGIQRCMAHKSVEHVGVHMGYRAQKGAASIGVLGLQALLQQLLAEG